jgi:PAS domain-containing protein
MYAGRLSAMGHTGSNQEITERKLAEEKLRESEARYRRMYDTAREGIWGVDADYRIQYANPQMAEMLGYTVEDVLGRHVTDFVVTEEKPDAEQRFEHRRKGQKEQFERRSSRFSYQPLPSREMTGLSEAPLPCSRTSPNARKWKMPSAGHGRSLKGF